MRLDELQDHQKVIARTGRGGRNSVEWDDWAEHTLYVQHDRKGTVCVVTLRDMSWAEASPQDLCRHPEGDILLVEDYYLQIKSLNDTPNNQVNHVRKR